MAEFCCTIAVAYRDYEPNHYYPESYWPSFCWILLIIVVLLLIYCWLRPSPPRPDGAQIRSDIAGNLTMLTTRLTAMGVPNAGPVVAQAQAEVFTVLTQHGL